MATWRLRQGLLLQGVRRSSFAFNTAATGDLHERQFELMRRFVRDTEIDLYAYATFTSPSDRGLAAAMEAFVDRLQGIARNLPLRTIPC